MANTGLRPDEAMNLQHRDIETLAKKKKVELPTGLMDIRIHDLRRTLGSFQAAAGANQYIIGKSLGHKSQQATAVYARLACDLTDNQNLTSDPTKWKAPNPNAAEIRKIRNAIEHGWLRVAEHQQPVWDASGDFAHVVTPDELQKQTLFVLKLVRAAMLYLSMAVSYHEKNKPAPKGLVATMPIHMVDDDLVSF